MKKIAFDEEFQVENTIFIFSKLEDQVKLKVVRKSKGKAVFQPPTIEEVKAYFKKEGYKEEIAIKAFNHYNRGDWKDSKGNQVNNWKQKMGTNWMTPENQIQKQEEKLNSQYLF